MPITETPAKTFNVDAEQEERLHAAPSLRQGPAPPPPDVAAPRLVGVAPAVLFPDPAVPADGWAYSASPALNLA